MDFYRRAAGKPDKLGVLPGAFNPPTRAHLALAGAALSIVEEVLFVLPRVFPHKSYNGAGFEDRLRLLTAAVANEPRYSVAATASGLFIDVARECRSAYGEHTELAFLCGRDAAERIVNWDYGEPGAFREMLGCFELLVASRRGEYAVPGEMRGRIRPLDWSDEFEQISATEVRERIAREEPWEYLVPEPIVPLVREIYPAGGSKS